MLVKYSIASIAPSNAPENQVNVSYRYPSGTEGSGMPKDKKGPTMNKIVNMVLPGGLNLNNKTKLTNQRRK